MRSRTGLAPALIAIALLGCSPSPEPIVIAPTPPPIAADPNLPIAAAPRKPRTNEPPPIAWLGSEPDARARARAQQTALVVYVRADWAASCVPMEREVWTAPEVRRAARGLVMLRLDVSDTEGDNAQTSQRYDVPTIPSIVIVRADGQSTVLAGRVTPADLARELNAALP